MPCYGENGYSSFFLLFCFYEMLTNFEDPYWKPLQNAWCGIQEATCDSVNCSVIRWWWWNIQQILKRFSVLLFKITGRWLADVFFKGWIEVSNSLWGATRVLIFRISKCFHRSKQELKKIFFLTIKMQIKLKTISACTQSTDLIFKTFKKIIHLGTLSLRQILT
jgi:hypothetical protein